MEALSPSAGRAASLVAPGIVLGLGLGGFVDGIVLHQVAQWHNMLSSTGRWPATTLEGMERNMLADGLFHAVTWILVALGLWLLWKARREAGQASGWGLVGWMLAGWGIFNLVEGVLDHQLLGIHHVRGESLAWDLSFLAFGAVLLLGGWLLARAHAPGSASQRAAVRGSDVSAGTYRCTNCGNEVTMGSKTHVPPLGNGD